MEEKEKGSEEDRDWAVMMLLRLVTVETGAMVMVVMAVVVTCWMAEEVGVVWG